MSKAVGNTPAPANAAGGKPVVGALAAAASNTSPPPAAPAAGGKQEGAAAASEEGKEPQWLSALNKIVDSFVVRLKRRSVADV